MKTKDGPFWETKKIKNMTREEWESLCDGCGKCCLLKTGFFKVRFTNLACKLLDLRSGKCKYYENRHAYVPECVVLTPDNLRKNRKWLPRTCAYLWVLDKGILPPWHPFISGDQNSVHKMGISVRGRAITREKGLDIERYTVSWDDL